MARAQGPGAPGGVRGSNPSLPSIFAGISGIGLTSLTLAGQHARSRRRCPYCPPCGVRRNYNPFAFPSRLCRLLFGSVAHCIRVMFPPPRGSPSRLGGFFPNASRAWSIRASSSAIYASDAAATFTGLFLCLLALALLCAESVYGIAPPTSPFSTHCRSIRLKICSAIWLPRNRRRRFRLTAVASGAFSVSSSPQNHYTRCCGRSPLPVAPAIWSHAGIPPAASETVPQHLSSPDPFCAYMRRRSLFPFWPLPHENIFRPLT